eukprot:CAMPEP_0115507998 /NCGR_PEP_ID=MMETSP0271-20121206/72057_1 /TAXON_ID=71861 /ORGANISM="Scrippsiella trochoidea, Strain CCMP3099" /LENGTH=53 /DNA_ID=CAMNT_0002937691 /DNA_START=1 /DNA_END=159 /DNA_ORIENTATION=+
MIIFRRSDVMVHGLVLAATLGGLQADLVLDESQRGFFLRHHTYEWIQGRPELP